MIDNDTKIDEIMTGGGGGLGGRYLHIPIC